MLGCGQLAGVEQLVVTAAVGAHGAPCDLDGGGHRDHQQDEQHGDGEPTARYRGSLLQNPVQLLVDPVGEFLGQGVFGVDRFVELALCGLVCGFAVDVDGGHCQPVLTNSL